MRWRVLGPLLVVVLLGAVIFSRWPSAEQPIPVTEPSPPIALPSVPAPAAPAAAVPTPTPRAPVAAPAPAAPPPQAKSDVGALVPDPVPDEDYARSLGLAVEPEPEDAGVLHALTRDGIKGAIQQELPELRECYEAWLEQNPALAGKLKVQFTIVEVPGKERGKVVKVDTADGGLGHLAFEGCVKNVFSGLRFERPEHGGEMRVTYPLAFENRAEKP